MTRRTVGVLQEIAPGKYLGGGLFDGIDDGCAGGSGNRCAGINTGVMALTTLASWQMRFSVGMDEVLISGCCDEMWVNMCTIRSARKFIFRILIPAYVARNTCL